MVEQDIRWKQRLNNYSKALAKLEEAVTLASKRELSDLETQGLIQGFEFTHELAWNVMKDYFEYEDSGALITGSRSATRHAFLRNLIIDGDSWMDMLKDRNQTSHTYNQETANEIGKKILSIYFSLFKAFEIKMKEIDSQ